MNQKTSIEQLKGQQAPNRLADNQSGGQQVAIAEARQVSMGFATMASFELMQRAAKLLSSSTLVPTSYQNNIPNCVVALNMAQRIGADPLMVMQNLYVVHGNPGWSAQFLIATFNQCGRFSSIKYEFSGDKDTDESACEAYATELSTGEEIRSSKITITLAKAEGWYQKNGSKWQTMPQQMLMYRSAAWLVRAYAPEIAMGLQTAEELHDVYDAKQNAGGQYVVDTESVVETVGQVDDGTEELITDSNGEIFDPEIHLGVDRLNQDKTFTKRPVRHNKPATQKETPAEKTSDDPLTQFVAVMNKATNMNELQEAREQANGPAVGFDAEQHEALDVYYRTFETKLKGGIEGDAGAGFDGME